MPSKRFRAHRRYVNTRVWSVTALILLVGSFALYSITSQVEFPQVALGIALAGGALSVWKDRKERIHYSVEGGQLILQRRQVVERIDMGQIQDASLVDRSAARNLLLERMRWMEEQGMIPAERDEFQRRFTRWCTVGIGSGAFAIGTGLVDHRLHGKDDLVLLRLRNGGSIVLSPVHNQDLITALNKDQEPSAQRRRRA